MNRAILVILSAVVLGLLGEVYCVAADIPRIVAAPPEKTGFDAKVKLWESLTPQEKAKLRARWEALSAEDKAKLKARYERLQKLTPEERQRLMENLRKFNALPKEKQEALLRLRAMMQNVPAPMRAEIRHKFHSLMDMPQDRREAVLKRLQTVQELLQNDIEELKKFQPDTAEFSKAVMEIRMKNRLLSHLPPAELEKLKGMTPDQRDGQLERFLHEGIMRPHLHVPPMIHPAPPQDAPEPAKPEGGKI